MFKSVFVCMFALITLVLFTGCPATPPGDDGGNNPPPDDTSSITQFVDSGGATLIVGGAILTIKPDVISGPTTIQMSQTSIADVPFVLPFGPNDQIVSAPVSVKCSAEIYSKSTDVAATVEIPIISKNLSASDLVFPKVQMVLLDEEGTGWPLPCEINDGWVRSELSTALPSGIYLVMYLPDMEMTSIDLEEASSSKGILWPTTRINAVYNTKSLKQLTVIRQGNIDIPAYWTPLTSNELDRKADEVLDPVAWAETLVMIRSATASLSEYMSAGFRPPHLKIHTDKETDEKYYVIYFIAPWTLPSDDEDFLPNPYPWYCRWLSDGGTGLYYSSIGYILYSPYSWWTLCGKAAQSPPDSDMHEDVPFIEPLSHEFFHSLFRSYEISGKPINYGGTLCPKYQTSELGINESLATYFQRHFGNKVYARTSNPEDLPMLSSPLFDFHAGLTYRGNNYFKFIERSGLVSEQELMSLSPGILEAISARLSNCEPAYCSDTLIMQSIYMAIENALNQNFPNLDPGLRNTFWSMTKDIAFEHQYPLRKSDKSLQPGTLNDSVFESKSMATLPLASTGAIQFDTDLNDATRAMLRNMPMCSSRVVRINSSFAKRGKLKLHFQRDYIGEAGDLGDWLRVKAYHGADSAELGEQEEELTVNNLGAGNDTVYLLMSNASRFLPHSVRVTGEWQTLEGGTYRFVGTLDLVVDPTGKLAEAGVQAGKEIEYRVTLNFDQQGRQTRDGTVETLEDLYDHFPLPTGGEYVILKDRFLATDFQGLRMQNVLTPGPVQAGKISKYELGEFWGEYSAPPGVVPNLSGDYTLTGGSDNDLLLMINTEYNRGELPQVESTPKWTVLETLTDEQGRQSAIYAKMRIAEFY